MTQPYTIKELYPLALAEGEGVGTAYEYFAKRLVLTRWLASEKAPRTILIAGLPQKYGSSLDFFLLAKQLGAHLTVVDIDPAPLAKAQRSLRAAQNEGLLRAMRPTFTLLENWNALPASSFELALCSEVLQRLPADERPSYVAAVRGAATRWAAFCPNADNSSHLGLSGLGGLSLSAMQTLFPSCPTQYIDMPPFPPGITRTENQRAQATSGRKEALAMWGLGYYARAEKWLPTAVRRRYAHIVYALWG